MAPASGGCTPQSTFTIVLLPAPFSPRRAWISPASHENSAPSSATTPPNRLSIPVALRRGMLVLKSLGRDEQVTHLSLLVKPETETIVVRATPASPDIPNTVLHAGAARQDVCPRM